MLFHTEQEGKENTHSNAKPKPSTRLSRSKSVLSVNTKSTKKNNTMNPDHILKPIQFDREKTVEELNRRRESRIELKSSRLSIHTKLTQDVQSTTKSNSSLKSVATKKRTSISSNSKLKNNNPFVSTLESSKKLTKSIVSTKPSGDKVLDSLTSLQLLQTQLLSWCYVNSKLESTHESKICSVKVFFI